MVLSTYLVVILILGTLCASDWSVWSPPSHFYPFLHVLVLFTLDSLLLFYLKRKRSQGTNLGSRYALLIFDHSVGIISQHDFPEILCSRRHDASASLSSGIWQGVGRSKRRHTHRGVFGEKALDRWLLAEMRTLCKVSLLGC
jgi:hypothetical protein